MMADAVEGTIAARTLAVKSFIVVPHMAGALPGATMPGMLA